MNTDILIVHPYKHHAFNLAAGCKKSGLRVKAVFPLYEKGFGAFLKYIPGKIGRKASGYVNDGLDKSDVVSPFFWQIRKLWSFLGDPMDFQIPFDTYVAKKIRQGKWHAKVIVLLQDHMPETARAAKKAGIRLWSDQINYSYEAKDRILAHWRQLGFEKQWRDESDNYEILAMADYVTAPSSYALDAIKKYAVSAKKITVVPYGVDGRKFYPPISRIQSEQIEFFARANTVAKGGDIFLNAIAQVGTTLVNQLNVERLLITILGDLDDVVKRLMGSLAFDPRISFVHGAVPSADVPNMLRRASVFIMPSLSESMSLACIEAMRCGLPILMSIYVGVDAFKDGAMGIKITPNINSLSTAMLFFAEEKDKWASWGEESKKAADLLSWSTYENEISVFIANEYLNLT